jgi:AraC-like DNA-binding protein
VGTEPRVSACAASGVLGVISQAGGDSDRILGAARLNITDVQNPSALLDLRSYCDMFEQASRQTGNDNFGLRFGRGYKVEHMGPLGRLALHSPTLGAALKSLCGYFPALQEHSALRLRDDGDLLHLEYHIRDGRITQRRQDAELSIGIFSNFFRRSLGPDWSPEEIHFEHFRVANPGEHETLLNAPVYFAQPTNAIVFRRAELTAPMPEADLHNLTTLQAELDHRITLARPDDFAGRVAHEIRLGFGSGDASIEAVAQRLGMSRAKLYRQLALAGAEFTALTQTIRHELALNYVGQRHIPLTEIAQLLGYSELSAFSRAFRRWTGESPVSKRFFF